MNQNIILKQDDTNMNIVNNNPYRILGVFANSPKRDIVANKGKATAFLKVNRPVEYPLDLKGLLPSVSRTLDIMNEAEAHLAIAKEQIKFAQFWFLKMTQLDEIAFNHLYVGKMDEAISIWSKQDNISSLQNKMICYLIKSSISAAVSIAQQLYSKFGDDYIEMIDSSCTIKMTGKELRNLFIDSLGESIDIMNLLRAATDADWKTYIINQTISPLINKISSEVEKTKKVDHKDSKARIDAARMLVASTKEPFNQLKSILPLSDPQFQMTADKLGLEILQCGIDYFNNSEDDDAPHTAMKMQKYAQSIVVGTLAKQRCEENVKILQKIIDELPPKELISNDKAIKKSLDKYVKLPANIGYAINLLNESKQHLQYAKVKLGSSNSYYMKMSTQVVALALRNVIEVVNNVQNDPQISVKLQLGIGLDSFSLNKIKSTIQEAWKAISIMDDFDLEPGFRPHYNENKNTLKSMCRSLGIPTNEHRMSSKSAYPSGLGYTGCERVHGDASAGGAFWDHIKSPESSKWQAALIVTIIGGVIGFLIYYNNPYVYEVDDKFKCIAWGTGIGAISWLCIFVDNDNRSGDWGDLAARGGCYGVILFLGLFIFYWIYKLIRLAIDGIKGM